MLVPGERIDGIRENHGGEEQTYDWTVIGVIMKLADCFLIKNRFSVYSHK